MWERAELPWLCATPDDFRERRKGVAKTNAGAELRALATYALNVNQLSALAGTIRQLRVTGGDLRPLQPLKLALLGDGSHELISDALVATAARYGFVLDLVDIPFNSIESIVLDHGSTFHREKPDIAVLNFTFRSFQHFAGDAFDNFGSANATVAAALARIGAICEGIRSGCGASIILQTVARPTMQFFGGIERQLVGTPQAILDAINRGIIEHARSPHVLLDIAALAETVGLDRWHDHAQWHSYKLPFSQHLCPLYADHLLRTVAAMRGLSKKCLVLDLDNTLWGGVVGDDGVEGLRLGQGFPDGEAFLEVQRTAQYLRQRGIILAVSSKNSDEVARRAFREHPDMILSEADITVFQANWDDKASNLELIAKTLDVGVDSLVFLDDNPAERELVRQRLPQVAVPELPCDPALYPQVLLASGYFDVVSYSTEDRHRADLYAARAAAADLKAAATDLVGYLASLDMTASFAYFDALGRSRIAQLINKSNQFNLTTRRYREAEILAMETDPALLTLQVRLKDRFADHGMISVAIVRKEGDEDWEIDAWLMSCRVIGRRVEEALLVEMASQIGARGGRRLWGRFVPSGRNDMVSRHYEKLGFSKEGEKDGETTWRMNIEDYAAPDLPMKISHAAVRS